MAVIDRDRRTIARQSADDGPYDTPLVDGQLPRTLNSGTPNTPVHRRVRLHDQVTGKPLREVWSNPVTGAWQFTGIRAGTFFVVAFDHTGQYNGEIATDIVLPAPGA